MGYSTHGNLMKAIRAENPHLSPSTSATLHSAADGTLLRVSGILMVIQRPPTAKGTCFITLEDEFGSMDVILRSEIFERYRDIISNSRILQLSGRVQVGGTAHTLMVDHVEAPALTHHIRGKNVYHGMHPRELKMDFEE
jgi:DNA polymerase III alpha subunit